MPRNVTLVNMRSHGWSPSLSGILMERSGHRPVSKEDEDSGDDYHLQTKERDPRNDLPMPRFQASFQSYEEIPFLH